MATHQSPIESLPIAKETIIDHKPFKKYRQVKDPLTHIVNPEIGPFDIKIKKQKPDKFYFGIRIVTGAQGDAGTIASAYTVLIGDKAKTENVSIQKIFHHSEKSGTYDDLIVECDRDLGNIQLVTVGIDKRFSPSLWASWYVEYTLVKNFQNDKETIFPCYHWIALGDHFTNAASCSTMKQAKENNILVEGRENQVWNRQHTYTWRTYEELGMPSSIEIRNELLPLDERFDKCKEENFLGNKFKGALVGLESGVIRVANDMLSKMFGQNVGEIDQMHSLHAFYEPAKLLEIDHQKADVAGRFSMYDGPTVTFELARWTSDAELGRQILNGVNCIIVQRCTKLPPNFPVTQEMVKPSLVRSGNLIKEMEAGYVYISDLSEIMDELLCKQDHYCAAPLCLLYVNQANQLVPIAIQLMRQPGEDNPIFLPSDNRTDWMLAKMFFSSASAQQHQITSHLATCHLPMEAYGVATMRTLPDAHPVYKLLRPSFHYTMAINTKAREALINDGGIIDFLFSIGGDDANSGKNEVFRRTNRIYNVHWSNIKRSIAERGVGDADKLPNYFYRDDGVRLWDAIEAYAKSIIDLFYSEDKDVAEDIELKNWAWEVHNRAFPTYGDNPVGRGFPLQITSKAELLEYCTLIMFTGSVQHSAVNFGQFQIYGYVPNSPMNLRIPLPNKKGVLTTDDLLQALPSALSTVLSSTVTYTLSQFSPEEVFMGGYPQNWFSEENANACIESFRKSLKQINESILLRNKELELPYVFLLSSRCPVSITI